MTERIKKPTRLLTDDGLPRRVGVEIEFGGLAVAAAAAIVEAQFGGTISVDESHRMRVVGTDSGDFTVELDSSWIHGDRSPSLFRSAAESLGIPWETIAEPIRTWFGHLASGVIPCEIVCPPMAVEEIGWLDDLVTALRAAGALGTDENPLYAFGLQLNPEIAEPSADYLVAILRAYLLLSEWLRGEVKVDLTRSLLAFAHPFPDEYAAKVIDPSYRPGLLQFMDDYLSANPTRNRELDLLPLFAWFDRSRVDAAVGDPLVKARPTFHYRLPNAGIGDPHWSVSAEWNRWVAVETLADDADRLQAMARAWLDRHQRPAESWAGSVARWVRS